MNKKEYPGFIPGYSFLCQTNPDWASPMRHIAPLCCAVTRPRFAVPIRCVTRLRITITKPYNPLPMLYTSRTRTLLHLYFTYGLRYNLMLIHPFIVFIVSSSIGLMVLDWKDHHRYIPQYSESCHQDTVPNTAGLSMLRIRFSLTIEVLSSTVHPIHEV